MAVIQKILVLITVKTAFQKQAGNLLIRKRLRYVQANIWQVLLQASEFSYFSEMTDLFFPR